MGSRNHPNSKVQKTLLRYLLGQIFRFLIYFLFKIKFYDTQCGYKLYKNTVAKKIFSKLKDDRFAHDVEVILIANFMKILIDQGAQLNFSKINLIINLYTRYH